MHPRYSLLSNRKRSKKKWLLIPGILGASGLKQTIACSGADVIVTQLMVNFAPSTTSSLIRRTLTERKRKMKLEILRVSDIRRSIRELGEDIRREGNTKEKSRLVDDQAALKRTLRLIPSKEVEIKLNILKR